MIKSRRIKWEEHVARMGKGNMHIVYWKRGKGKETIRKTISY
jgi:hypothetical protein